MQGSLKFQSAIHSTCNQNVELATKTWSILKISFKQFEKFECTLGWFLSAKWNKNFVNVIILCEFTN